MFCLIHEVWPAAAGEWVGRSNQCAALLQALVRVVLGLDNGQALLEEILTRAGVRNLDILQTHTRYDDAATMHVVSITCQVRARLLFTVRRVNLPGEGFSLPSLAPGPWCGPGRRAHPAGARILGRCD
jgi:hypothetical protein